ncbi:MAG: Uma2 family endonuclease [Chloroflexi bacterium]|nr:MAG: Uma2 family endonuclease [Chloroflexota bacterium]
MFAAKMKPRWISSEEYLAQEETSTDRHEYLNGQIYMMAGGTHNHERIVGNVFAALHQYARRKKCTAYGSNMKILVKANGLYTYPDAMLVCGKIGFAAERKDIIINPLLIVEVLSDSTQSYDRGDKFALYRGIPIFTHYLLIHQDRPLVEYHRKTGAGWLLTEVEGKDAALIVDPLELQLPFDELYEGVDWLPAEEE